MTDFERLKDGIIKSNLCYVEQRTALSLLNLFGARFLYLFLMDLTNCCKDSLITCYREDGITNTTMVKCDHLKGV